jgi:hypothetical protein
MSMLRLGSHNQRVLRLEKRLKDLGYLEGPANQRFGKATERAVVDFKTDHGWDNPRPVAGKKLATALKLGDQFEDDASRPKKMKGGSYNCLIGRPPGVVHDVVKGFLKKGNLDFLQLQEISQYHHALNNIPGYKLITFPGSKDHGESGVLVRKGIEAKFPQSIEANSGWTAVTGHPAAPRAATSVQLAGWLRVTSVHLPPAIDFKNGHAVGPAARVKSYLSSMKELLKAAKRNERNNPDGAMLIGGDWNEGPNSTGVGSPNWLARMAGMKKYPAGHIDWEMARGCKVSHVKRGPAGGSDHHLITFTISA